MTDWELAKAGNLGMYWEAAEQADWTRPWVPPPRSSDDETDDQRLNRLLGAQPPPCNGHEQDESCNLLSGLLADTGQWDRLDEVLSEHWARGGGAGYRGTAVG